LGIGDHDLSAFRRGPAARRPAINDHVEVLEELVAETVLGRDPQRSGHRASWADSSRPNARIRAAELRCRASASLSSRRHCPSARHCPSGR